MKQLLAALTVLSATTVFSQFTGWSNHTNKDHVSHLHTAGNKIWIGTPGGILVRDLQGNQIAEYTKVDGLATNQVTGITSDSDNNIWIATTGGVSKFNGTSWTTYNTSNSGLPSNSIISVFADSGDNIWFGFSAINIGVAKFDGSSWTVYNTLDSGISMLKVQTIGEGADGTMWFGNQYTDVYMFDGTSWTVSDSLAGVQTRAIARDEQGKMWFGTSEGVFTFDGTNWTEYNETGTGLLNNSVLFIESDMQGNVFIGTENGVSEFNGTDWLNLTQSNSLPYGFMDVCAIDSMGNVWFGSQFGGIHRLEELPQACTPFITGDNALFSNTILSIENDLYGNTWTGYNGNGTSMFNGSEWSTHHSEQAQMVHIEAIYTDQQGNTWFGAYGNLTKFDGADWTTYNVNPSIPNYNIVAINEDVNGDLWFGMELGGIATFDGIVCQQFTTANSDLPSDNVRAIAMDNNNTPVIGTDEGIARMEYPAWSIFDAANSPLPLDLITSIVKDNAGLLWVGTLYGDLCSFDGTNWTIYETLVPGVIRCLAIDGDNKIWIGTSAGQGLHRFDDNGLTTFNTGNSCLSVNDVRALSYDENSGVMWVGTNGAGVYQFKPEALGLDEQQISDDLKALVHPNPVTATAQIAFPNAGEKAFLTIYTISGEKVLQQETFETQFSIERNDFTSAGLYLFTIATAGKHFTGKLVVR